MKDDDGGLEWYVMCIGKSPVKVILGRREALFFFAHKFNCTLKEKQQLGRAWEKGMETGDQILLTAYTESNGGKVYPDRTLTRVMGPELK